MQVLLLEGEADVAASMSAALRAADAGCRIERAGTLAEGIRLAAERRFDAALADLTLPDASDCEIAHALRRAAPTLPIIALGGIEHESAALHLARVGVQDCLCKDVDSMRRLHQCLLFAIERERQKSELIMRACYDGLTGVMNRPQFELQVAKAVSHAIRNRSLGALVLLDIDDFKAINDSFGHRTGDLVLQQTASRLTRHVRTGDSIGRFGGDEFVALIEGLGESGKAAAVGRKLQHVTCHPVSAAGRRVPVATSLGVSIFPTEGTSSDQLLELADRRMYAAKRVRKSAGRTITAASRAACTCGLAR